MDLEIESLRLQFHKPNMTISKGNQVINNSKWTLKNLKRVKTKKSVHTFHDINYALGSVCLDLMIIKGIFS